MKLLATAWFCAFPALAQIAGTVRDANTRLPLHGAVLRIDDLRATTDELGRFRFDKVEPGRHWIWVSHEKLAGSGGATVLAQPDTAIENLEILLKTGGNLSGRVTDDRDRPLSGVSVLLLERRIQAGEIVYAPQRTVSTGEDGAYVFESVRADRGLLVLAKTKLKLSDAARTALAPTFYPNAPDMDGAVRITLASGESRTGLNIRMVSTPSFCLAGSTAEKAFALTEQQPLSEGWSLSSAQVVPKAKGEFRACGLHPGEYSALGEPISIRNRDIEGLILSAPAPPVLSVDLNWEGPPPDPESARSAFVFIGGMFEHGEADQAGRGGGLGGGLMFRIGGRVPGSYSLDRLSIRQRYAWSMQTSPGCYVKSATLNGAATPFGFLRMSGAARLTVALSCDGGALRMKVADRDGHPVSGGYVHLMPASAPQTGLPEIVDYAEILRGWAATARVLPPGKYLAVATGLELDGTIDAMERVWALRSRAKEVVVQPGAPTEVQLELIE